MLERLKIGVIGTGNMGKNHVRNLSNEQRFDLVGIYDKDSARAAEVASQYGASAYDDMEKLLEETEAVVIAAPSSLHKEIGLRAAEHGVHALIEKPLATNGVDARELAAAFSAKGLKLAVGHIERFNPAIQELRKFLDNSQVFYLESHRFGPFSDNGRIADTSVIEDLMIHDVDLICHLMEPYRVVSIQGSGERVRTEQVDFASCTLRFNGNVHASIHASRVSQDKERTLCVHTLDNCIYVDLLARTLMITKNTNFVMGGVHETTYRQNGVVERVFVPSFEPLRSELISFYEAVVLGKSPAVDGSEGVRAVEICEKVSTLVNTEREDRHECSVL